MLTPTVIISSVLANGERKKKRRQKDDTLPDATLSYL